MPRMPRWTRRELATAKMTADMMGLTTKTVLEKYVAETRRVQAAKHGMTVEDWVEENLAADWLLTRVETGHERGDSPDAIAAAVSKPVEDIRKILAGLKEDGHLPPGALTEAKFAEAVTQLADEIGEPRSRPRCTGTDRAPEWTRGELASAVLGAPRALMNTEVFLATEVGRNRRLVAARRGMSGEAWAAELNATDRLLTEIEEAHNRGDSPAVIAAAVGAPVSTVQPVVDVIAGEALGEPGKPRKDRSPEARRRAEAVAFQLKVSLRTAWKGYDEDNAERIAAEDEIVRVMKRMRALGLDFGRIADEVGGTAESLEGLLATHAHLV